MLRFKQFLLIEDTQITPGDTSNSTTGVGGLGIGGLNRPNLINPNPYNLPGSINPLTMPSPRLDDRYNPGRLPIDVEVVDENPNELTDEELQEYIQNNPIPPYPGENATPEQIEQFQLQMQQWLFDLLHWMNDNNYSVPFSIEEMQDILDQGNGMFPDATLWQRFQQLLGNIAQYSDYVDLAEFILFFALLGAGALSGGSVIILAVLLGLSAIIRIAALAGGVAYALYLLTLIPDAYRDFDEIASEFPIFGYQWLRDWVRENQGIGWPDFQRLIPGLFDALPFGDSVREWFGIDAPGFYYPVDPVDDRYNPPIGPDNPLQPFAPGMDNPPNPFGFGPNPYYMS